jgi:hypothetical protein
LVSSPKKFQLAGADRRLRNREEELLMITITVESTERGEGLTTTVEMINLILRRAGQNVRVVRTLEGEPFDYRKWNGKTLEEVFDRSMDACQDFTIIEKERLS